MFAMQALLHRRATPLVGLTLLTMLSASACFEYEALDEPAETSASVSTTTTEDGTRTAPLPTPGTSAQDTPTSGTSAQDTPTPGTSAQDTPTPGTSAQDTPTPGTSTPEPSTPEPSTPEPSTPEPSITDDRPERRTTLFASPDRIDVEPGGEAITIRIQERSGWDEASPVTSFTATISDAAVAGISESADGTLALQPLEAGRTTLTIETEETTIEVPVRVGPSLLLVDGNMPIWAELNLSKAELGAATTLGESVAESTTSVRREGDRIYLVFSGPFGSTDATSLLVLDAQTLAVLHAHEAFLPTGAWEIVVVAPDDVVLIGPGDGLVRMNPETGDIIYSVGLEDDDLEAPITFASGGHGIILDNLLILANSALDRSDFSYFPGQLLLWDLQMEGDEEADADPRLFDAFPDASGDRRPWLPLPTGCVNPADMVIDGTLLHVRCTGNFGDLPGGVATIDLVDLSAKSFIAVSAGSVGAMVVDTFRGEAVLASATSLSVALVDLIAGEVLLDFDETSDFESSEQGFFDANMLHLQDDGEVLLVNYGRGALYRFWPEELDEDIVIPIALEISPSLLGSARHLVPITDRRAPLPLTADNVTVIHPSPGEGFANPTNLLGLPMGGGNFAPNFSSDELTTAPAGETLELWLQGVTLVDGPGDDLVIFENVLFLGGDRFRRAVDPARVSFSADGLTWVDYPVEEDDAYPIGGFAGGFATDARRYISGFVGIEPVYANRETNRIPIESRAAGGDRFDLSRVGLPEVRAIRVIADHESNGQPDIDAIGLLNWRTD